MKDTIMLAIDPGLSGGMAWEKDDKVYIESMPKTPKDIFELLENISGSFHTIKCYIEKAGTYVSGNSGPAAAKFARHCGMLEGFLIALGISYQEILPSVWQQNFIGKPNYPKIPKEIQGNARKRVLAQRKKERKNKIKIRAQALYPDLKITLATSDALGILSYLTSQ